MVRKYHLGVCISEKAERKVRSRQKLCCILNIIAILFKGTLYSKLHLMYELDTFWSRICLLWEKSRKAKRWRSSYTGANNGWIYNWNEIQCIWIFKQWNTSDLNPLLKFKSLLHPYEETQITKLISAVRLV